MFTIFIIFHLAVPLIVFEVPRIKIGFNQTIDTLISEEALLFAKFLRTERHAWVPRVVRVNSI